MPRTNQRHYRHPEPQLPPLPLGWKVWLGLCALIGLGVLGVAVWAVIAIVNHVTR